MSHCIGKVMPDSDRGAIDRRDDRLLHIPRPDRGRLTKLAAFATLVVVESVATGGRQVCACAERAAGPGNDNDPHLILAVERGECLREFRAHGRVVRVEFLGSIECDGRDAIRDLHQQRRISHRSLPPLNF
jgi:hypothetical protein